MRMPDTDAFFVISFRALRRASYSSRSRHFNQPKSCACLAYRRAQTTPNREVNEGFEVGTIRGLLEEGAGAVAVAASEGTTPVSLGTPTHTALTRATTMLAGTGRRTLAAGDSAVHLSRTLGRLGAKRGIHTTQALRAVSTTAGTLIRRQHATTLLTGAGMTANSPHVGNPYMIGDQTTAVAPPALHAARTLRKAPRSLGVATVPSTTARTRARLPAAATLRVARPSPSSNATRTSARLRTTTNSKPVKSFLNQNLPRRRRRSFIALGRRAAARRLRILVGCRVVGGSRRDGTLLSVGEMDPLVLVHRAVLAIAL